MADRSRGHRYSETVASSSAGGDDGDRGDRRRGRRDDDRTKTNVIKDSKNYTKAKEGLTVRIRAIRDQINAPVTISEANRQAEIHAIDQWEWENLPRPSSRRSQAEDPGIDQMRNLLRSRREMVNQQHSDLYNQYTHQVTATQAAFGHQLEDLPTYKRYQDWDERKGYTDHDALLRRWEESFRTDTTSNTVQGIWNSLSQRLAEERQELFLPAYSESGDVRPSYDRPPSGDPPAPPEYSDDGGGYSYQPGTGQGFPHLPEGY